MFKFIAVCLLAVTVGFTAGRVHGQHDISTTTPQPEKTVSQVGSIQNPIIDEGR